jgi:hypothetical protein
MNRLLGIILIVVGAVVGLVAAAWLFSNEGLTTPARILGLGIALLVLVAPLVGGGIYILAQGMGDVKVAAEAGSQRKLLNLVQSRGQVKLDDAALELQVPRDRLRDMVHSLVGLGVFSGYINWDEGTLYSSDASELKKLTVCPNCGGEITLSGKGVARCRFCGTEFFLS